MARRLIRMGMWFAAALALCGPSRAADPQRIVAVGDLHGDHQAWRAIARAARLIDQRGHWTGGRATLVQVGDVVDRGPDSLKIIDDMERLRREARRSGGQVVVLVGNHEAMMLTGDLRYVHPGEYRAFVTSRSEALRNATYEAQRKVIEAAAYAKDPSISPAAVREAWMRQVPLGMVEHQQAWSPDGRLGRWAIGNPAAVRIGDTLFVHGGISSTYAGLSLEEINRRVADALRARSEDPMAIINDSLGPLWYRGLLLRSEEEERPRPDRPAGSGTAPAPRPTIEQELDLVLTNYRVRRVVVGHTPALRGIAVRNGGKLVQVDSGISAYYGGTLSFLEIQRDRLTAHTVPRPSTSSTGRR